MREKNEEVLKSLSFPVLSVDHLETSEAARGR